MQGRKNRQGVDYVTKSTGLDYQNFLNLFGHHGKILSQPSAFGNTLTFLLDTSTWDLYTYGMTEKGEYVYDWPRPMVTVDAVVFNFDRDKWHVLLIKRGHEPFKGQWDIPGGFVGMDEELADAAGVEME